MRICLPGTKGKAIPPVVVAHGMIPLPLSDAIRPVTRTSKNTSSLSVIMRETNHDSGSLCLDKNNHN